MAHKRYLFTPGPTPVPPQVLAALAEPVRPPPRTGLQRGLRPRPRAAAGGASDWRATYFSSPARGRGRSSPRSSNLCAPGERVLAVSAGSFGERWVSMARTYGCDVEELATPGARRRRPRISGESSTRSTRLARLPRPFRDVDRRRRRRPALAAVAKEAGALVVVDAVSSLGAVPLEIDEWGLDASSRARRRR